MLALQKPPYIKRLTFKPPRLQHQDDFDVWSPYPKLDEQVTGHTICLLNYHATLAEIAWDLAQYLFADNKAPSCIDAKGTADLFHTRLLEWKGALPECIQEENAIPGVLCLQ